MKITILGCGNAFSTKNFNNCILLEDKMSAEHVDAGKTRRLLIDAGWALPFMLKNSNIDVKSITDVYISHRHSDHIGGLEFLGFSRYDFVNKPSVATPDSPTLICNENLMGEVWESLKGGMSCLEGIDATIGTYWNLQPISPNQKFFWCGWECRLVQQIHIMAGSMITNTFGLIMKKPGHQTVYFVTDSQHCSPRQAEIFYEEADIIFQDCELIGVDMSNETMRFCSNVHANYAQLAGYKNVNAVRLPGHIKAGMWLTHYQDFKDDNVDFFGNPCNWDERAKEDGFLGFVHVGQTFEV